MVTKFSLIAIVLTMAACNRAPSVAPARELHVAAAANLSEVMPSLSRAFAADSGLKIIPSFGATAQLAQQIENGGPFDVFLAADKEHVDSLVKNGFALDRAIYARGELVIWTNSRTDIHSIEDLAGAGVHTVAVAKPELAPYGRAAVEALRKSGAWDRIQPKVVYAQNISAARTYVETGNCDAAFTALSLVIHGPGQFTRVDPALFSPIDQALCIVARSKNTGAARRFTTFLQSATARAIWKSYGYTLPGRP